VRRAGFTLIEVLAALLVLGIALTALLSTQTGGIRLRSRAEAITVATFLLQARMTELELGPVPEVGTREGDFGPDRPEYRWELAVADAPFPPNVREVRLAVRWPEGRGEERLELTSFRSTEASP
jgi:general secretion pathway protein I